MSASRVITVAAAQLGPIQLATPRSDVLDRMLRLLENAAGHQVQLVVFPELALTTFFPRHIIEDPIEVAKYFEHESDESPLVENAATKPLFDAAKRLGIDICFGYAERWSENGQSTDYNTMVYYSAAVNKALAKYRKVHLPGTKEPIRKPNVAEQLEKRYFTPGNLGFQAFRVPHLVDSALKARDVTEQGTETEGKGDPILGMLICNDRRWPEGWRCYGLQGAELVLQGYNTTGYAPQRPGTVEEQKELAVFHHRLACQAGSNCQLNHCSSWRSDHRRIEDAGGRAYRCYNRSD